MIVHGCSGKVNRILAAMALFVAATAHESLSENLFTVRKRSETAISIELSNTNLLGGAQFSIVAEGGIILGVFEESVRLIAANVSVFQFQSNDSTLNVVLLARTQSFLPAGTGGIGVVSFGTAHRALPDTMRVKLSRVVICNADAEVLKVSTESLAWSTTTRQDLNASAFRLEPNYPNPFNPSTTIAFSLDGPGSVRLSVYDVAGREVKILVDKYLEKGRYSAQWSIGEEGSSIASGVYFARLQVGNAVALQKMITTR